MNRRFLLLTSAVLLAGVTYVLGWSSLFTVRSIEIVGGNSQIISGIVAGQKLARVEPRAVAARFEKLDWVAKAKVSRNWINGKILIELTERTPVAIYNNLVIDSTGKSFEVREGQPTNLVKVQAGDLAAAIRAVAFFTTLPSDLKSTLMVVKIRSSGALVLVANNAGKNIEIRWGRDTDKELKIKVYKALIALPENAAIKRVDVSAPHAPIVK